MYIYIKMRWITLFIFGFVCTLKAQKTGETYYIQSAVGGKYLEVKGSVNSRLTPFQLGQYTGGKNQKFELLDAGGGYFYIKSKLGRALHIWQANKNPKAQVNLWEIVNQANLKWRIKSAGNGYYYIQSKLGNYLDVQWGKNANGTPIWMWSFNGGIAQKWKFKSLPKRLLEIDKNGKVPVVVSVTGVRGIVHNDDCKKITGSFNISLFEDEHCNIPLKPEVYGSNSFKELIGPHTSINRIVHQNIASIYSYNDPDPKNIKKRGSVFSTPYKIDQKSLSNGVKLEVNGVFRGCHKSGDLATDYNCNLAYKGAAPIYITEDELRKGTIEKQVSFYTTDGQTHRLVFYIKIYSPMKII